jgi:hypothetical protein
MTLVGGSSCHQAASEIILDCRMVVRADHWRQAAAPRALPSPEWSVVARHHRGRSHADQHAMGRPVRDAAARALLACALAVRVRVAAAQWRRSLVRGGWLCGGHRRGKLTDGALPNELKSKWTSVRAVACGGRCAQRPRLITRTRVAHCVTARTGMHIAGHALHLAPNPPTSGGDGGGRRKRSEVTKRNATCLGRDGRREHQRHHARRGRVMPFL